MQLHDDVFVDATSLERRWYEQNKWPVGTFDTIEYDLIVKLNQGIFQFFAQFVKHKSAIRDWKLNQQLVLWYHYFSPQSEQGFFFLNLRFIYLMDIDGISTWFLKPQYHSH